MKKTVFVVGAGASKEVNLPTGLELRAVIADFLNIRFADFGNQTHGDKLVMEALQNEYAASRGTLRIGVGVYAGRRDQDL
jgi:hypothetical protein